MYLSILIFLQWQEAVSYTHLSEEDIKSIQKTLDLLDEDDDVQEVYTNWDE